MTNKRIHQIYSILLSILLIVSGICLIAACIGIYQLGDDPYTPETVAAAFSGITWSVYPCLLLILGGFILDIFFPAPKAKNAVQKQYDVILAKLHEKADPGNDPAIGKEQRIRRIHKFITAGLFLAGSVIFLLYGTNADNFDSADITGSMIRAMYWLLPCMAVPFFYAVFTAFYCKASIRREIELMKQQIAAGAAAPVLNSKKSAIFPLAKIRWVLLAAAVVFLVYGFIAGGTEDVLTKAVNICTECVGLG